MQFRPARRYQCDAQMGQAEAAKQKVKWCMKMAGLYRVLSLLAVVHSELVEVNRSHDLPQMFSFVCWFLCETDCATSPRPERESPSADTDSSFYVSLVSYSPSLRHV